MEDFEILDEERDTQSLPVFLKVMCILTFVGSGLGLLGAISGFFTAEMSVQNFEKLQSMGGSDAFGVLGVNLDEMLRWQQYMNIGNLTGAVLCLSGALLMWRLRKIGFFLYVPGWVIPTVISGIGLKYMMPGSGLMGSIGTIGIVVNVFLALVFITLYGVNFKHLK